MIVDQIDVTYISILEPEHHSPISADRNRPKATEVSFQGVQSKPGSVAVLDHARRVKPRQYSANLVDEPRRQPASIVLFKQASQATMPKAFDHPLIMISDACL